MARRTKTNTTTLYRASCETRHFSWEAYGATEEETLKLLRRALRANTDFTREELDTIIDETHAYAVHAGLALRDDEAVLS